MNKELWKAATELCDQRKGGLELCVIEAEDIPNSKKKRLVIEGAHVASEGIKGWFRRNLKPEFGEVLVSLVNSRKR